MGTSKQRPEISCSKTDFLEQPHLHPQARSRSTSQISEISLDGDITPTQNAPLADLSTTPESNIPSTPQQQTAFAGNWDQQFFDQAFMTEINGLDGTVDLLYRVGAAGMFANPTYPSSNYSPSLSYSSDCSMDCSPDNIVIDPKLTNEYDNLFDTNISFNNGNDICLTTPPLDFSTSFLYACLIQRAPNNSQHRLLCNRMHSQC